MPEVSYRGDYEGYRFMPDGKSIVILQGQFRAMDFWLVDLDTGERRQLTRLKPGYSVRNFDVSRDGKEILFDRVQENSDIVLIEPRRP
jgi:Tol biopolymer transport system component